MREGLIDELAANAGAIADVMASAPHGTLHRRPSADEWSIAEIIGHIRAADAIWSSRILFAVVHDGVAMPDVDERRLQAVMDSGGLALTERVTAFVLGRTELVGALRALDERSWSHTCRHERHGAMTVADLVSGLASHEREHLAQLRSAIET